MERQLFIDNNTIILHAQLYDHVARKYSSLKFQSYNTTAVQILINDVDIVQQGVLVDFNNDEGRLTVRRNGYAIAPGEYEVTVNVINEQWPTPGQSIIHPSMPYEMRQIFEVPE